MKREILRLYPLPAQTVELSGLYLEHRLFERGTKNRPFVYANFLASLDGRIAVEDLLTGETYLPKVLTTPADFRLFLELLAQADCLITHGGYLRALTQGKLGNVLQVDAHPLGEDLAEWRRRHGLSSQPAVAIASASLDFPIPPELRRCGQKVYIFTGEAADPIKVASWQKEGYPVFFAGRTAWVEGKAIVEALSALGHKTIYLIAGPRMLDTIVRDGCLSRLYQTISHQLLGGEAFRTMVPGGPLLREQGHLKLCALYYDPEGPVVGQWFSWFEPL